MLPHQKYIRTESTWKLCVSYAKKYQIELKATSSKIADR